MVCLVYDAHSLSHSALWSAEHCGKTQWIECLRYGKVMKGTHMHQYKQINTKPSSRTHANGQIQISSRKQLLISACSSVAAVSFLVFHCCCCCRSSPFPFFVFLTLLCCFFVKRALCVFSLFFSLSLMFILFSLWIRILLHYFFRSVLFGSNRLELFIFLWTHF